MKNGVSSVQFIICRATKYDFARVVLRPRVLAFQYSWKCMHVAGAAGGNGFSLSSGKLLQLRKRHPRAPSCFLIRFNYANRSIPRDRYFATCGFTRSRQARSRNYFSRVTRFSRCTRDHKREIESPFFPFSAILQSHSEQLVWIQIMLVLMKALL